MPVKRIAAVALIVLGILALVYGGFSYTEDTHSVDLGVAEFSIEDKERVNVPVWAGVVSIVVGAVLLIPSRR